MLLTKPPIWFRVICVILALPFILLAPIWLFIIAGCLAHSGPGGHSTYPYTFGDIAGGLAALILPPVYSIFFIWLAIGAPTTMWRSKQGADEIQEAQIK
jgi:hypothetical protein